MRGCTTTRLPSFPKRLLRPDRSLLHLGNACSRDRIAGRGKETSMGQLEGKVILITGGARGQGAAEARQCAAAGADVWVTDLLVADGEKVAADIGGHFLEQDVTNESLWNEVIDEIVVTSGSLDGLVNNAGIFKIVPMTQTTLDDYRRITEINQTGVFLGMRAAAKQMVAQQSGSIVNISSIAGLSGAASAFAYGASKWAVRGMTKSAAQELGPSNVRVNSIHPGIIETEMLQQFDVLGPDIRDRLTANIPLGRTGAAEEVSEVVFFLLSDSSRYCTGHEFVVDGGMRA